MTTHYLCSVLFVNSVSPPSRCRFVCQCLSFPASLSLCLSVCLSYVCSLVSMTTHFPVLSAWLALCLSPTCCHFVCQCLTLPVGLSVCLPACLCVSLPECLSVCLSVLPSVRVPALSFLGFFFFSPKTVNPTDLAENAGGERRGRFEDYVQWRGVCQRQQGRTRELSATLSSLLPPLTLNPLVVMVKRHCYHR